MELTMEEINKLIQMGELPYKAEREELAWELLMDDLYNIIGDDLSMNQYVDIKRLIERALQLGRDIESNTDLHSYKSYGSIIEAMVMEWRKQA